MADLIDRFPLAAESPESILARLQADLNAGIDPTDPLYADMLPGSVWDDMARADTLEFDRLYDRMLTDVPAAALPALATGLWLDSWADSVGLERKAATAAGGVVQFFGANGLEIPVGTQVSTEAPTADADPVEFQTTEGGTISGGFVELAVVALEEGTAGNVPANSVTLLDTPIAGVTVSNPDAITAGSDVETDEKLQERVVKRLRGTQGAGNIDYYEDIALNHPGVGFVTVQPNTPALGDVRVVIRDVNNDPVPTSLIDSLQAVLDPSTTSTQGRGAGTIGAEVTVTTPDPMNATIEAAVEFEDGYSLDGAAGTRALREEIEAAIRAYLESLGVGADVVRNKVLAAIVHVDGVADVASIEINGVDDDAAVTDSEVAVLALPITLTAA